MTQDEKVMELINQITALVGANKEGAFVVGYKNKEGKVYFSGAGCCPKCAYNLATALVSDIVQSASDYSLKEKCDDETEN